MRHSLIHFTVICLLFQCIQGVLHHFNTKRYPEDDYFFKKDGNVFKRSDAYDINGDANGLSQLRARRQNTENEPEGYSFALPNDDRQFARLSYIGGGSKVKNFVNLFMTL